jgi:hypothetical protein
MLATGRVPMFYFLFTGAVQNSKRYPLPVKSSQTAPFLFQIDPIKTNQKIGQRTIAFQYKYRDKYIACLFNDLIPLFQWLFF